MLTEKPAEVYLSDLIQISTDVFQTMLSTDAVPVEADVETAPEVTAAIHFTGQWNGALLIECSQAQACLLASRLLEGSEITEVDGDVIDAMAEMANMVGGNMKSILPRGVQISMPLVVLGQNYSIRMNGEALTTRAAFATELGLCYITLIEMLGA